MPRTTRRSLGAATLAIVAVVLGANAAGAHVEVQPSEAAQGSSATFVFSVENERDDAATTEVEIAFPGALVVPAVGVRPLEGWTYTVVTGPPTSPVEGQEAVDVVRRVVWRGGPLEGDASLDLELAIGPLPGDVDELVFPTLQTYSDGEVVRWIEEAPAGGAEPEHPAPVVALTPGEAPGTTAVGTATSVTTTQPSTTGSTAGGGEPRGEDGDGGPSGVLVAGIILVLLAVGGGGAAWARSRHR
jgi:uncharacterized protein YcnI